MEPNLSTTQANGLRRYYIRILVVICLIFAGFLAYIVQPPSTFPSTSFISINQGDTVTAVANNLKAGHYIRSVIVFKILMALSAGEQKLIAGDYYFAKPISVIGITARLINGNFDLKPLKVTIPEGTTMEQMSKIFSSKLPHFSVSEFLQSTSKNEGYLFPDTYFFDSNAKVSDIITTMQKNFDEKIKTVKPTIAASGKSENDVVTMASILEEEAQNSTDWQIISSILWKRIKIGMPLQVDSSLGYVTGKASSQLTTSDLKMQSPYNTYSYKGLPPTPICSPGIETIIAAATPTTTPYLYYLSDKNGVIHYAATFAEHIKNKAKYLK